MQAVGDQGLRAAEIAHDDLQRREHEIHPHADPSRFFGLVITLTVVVGAGLGGGQNSLGVNILAILALYQDEQGTSSDGFD